MDLTIEAQQLLEFTKHCYLQGMCTSKEYMRAVKKIYVDDAKKQVDFLMEQGFKRTGAWKHVYNLDSGEEKL